ncbi:hydrolase [Dorea formicigenerans]|uniref:coiled-coil domain-containing protein n=1 Tax=Dorea formicigenerans TaxID=39486 RepID=UPI001C02FF5C|nr:C40 family peptidase [Dorea formicigenerans]MBT9741050.1 hydrolase [Dorea formicigenerans]
MNKFGRRILAALITSSLVVTPVLAAPSVDDLQKSKASAQSEVNSLQSQLQSIVSKITQLEADLTTKGEEIIQAQADLEQAQEDEKTQYAAMKLRIKYMYEAGDATALESLVSSEDFSDLLSKAEYVQSVHGYDRDKLEEYVATKQKIADLKDQLETEQSQLESMQTEYETEESNLTTLIDSKQAEVADLDSQIQEAAEKAAKEEEERQKKAEEERQKQLQAASQNSTTTNSNSGNSNSSSSSSNKGNSSSSSSSSSGSYVSGSTVSRAYSALGKPYVWGAAGPNSFDCSGLVSFCLTGRYSHTYSSSDFVGLTKVSNPQPGDICVRVGHVGVYIGGGQMIHAPHTGDVVKISAVPSNMWYVRP